MDEKPLVGVVMGSQSDWDVMQHAARVLKDFGVAYEARVVSAHRTPDVMFEYAHSARARGLACIIAGRDVWPFLSYPMYADLVRGRRELFWLYGESRGRERPLHGVRYWHPADEQRLGAGLATLAGSSEGATRLHAALAALAERYERRRRSGEHDGPALDALRVYAVRWDVRSVRAVPRAPDDRALIAELRLDGEH